MGFYDRIQNPKGLVDLRKVYRLVDHEKRLNVSMSKYAEHCNSSSSDLHLKKTNTESIRFIFVISFKISFSWT